MNVFSSLTSATVHAAAVCQYNTPSLTPTELDIHQIAPLHKHRGVTDIQGVTGGMCETSGECSLC